MSEWDGISLGSIPFLAAASPRALARVNQRTQIIDYEPGEFVFREGDAPTHLYVIRTGNVEVLNVLLDGSEEVLRTLGPGQLLGELGILGGHARSATARTGDAAQIWEIEREAFLELYETEPAVALELAQVMAQYLLDAAEVAEDLLFIDLRGRIARRLLFLVNVLDSDVRRLVGSQGMTKDEVASVLKEAGKSGRLAPESFAQLDRRAMLSGGTRRNVAQILEGMQREGLLIIAEDTILLVDEEGLQAASLPA